MEELQKRKPIRLKDYDYSQNGYYFITICVKDRQELLGAVVVGDDAHIVPPDTATEKYVQLSEYGKITQKYIERINLVYEGTSVPKYIIMPNHLHLIIALNHSTGRCGHRPLQSKMIPSIVSSLKTLISKEFGFSPWQRSFHDHVIRNEAEYLKIWNYIDSNPLTWGEDKYFCGGEENVVVK